MSAPNSVLFAYSAGQGLSAATFTRASDAYRRNRDGTVTPATCAYVRLGWYDVDGDDGWEVPGTVLEGARTNAHPYSEGFDNAVWTKSQLTVTTDAIAAPDGSTLGQAIYETTSTDIHFMFDVVGAPSDDTLQSFSIFARALSTDRWLFLQSKNKAGGFDATVFDIQQGAITSQSTDHDASVEPYAGGWYRCAVTYESTNGASTDVRVNIVTADSSDGNVDFAGSTSKGIYLWGAQFEVDSPFVSTYIPTSAATASRAADTLTFPLNFGVQDVTIYAKFARPTWMESTQNIVIVPSIVAAGTCNPWIGLHAAAAARTLSAQMRDSGGTLVTASQNITTGETIEAAGQYRNLNTDPQVRLDVSTGFGSWSSTGSVNPPASFGSTAMRVGAAGPYEPLFGGLVMVKVAAGLLTLSEMRNLKTQYGK